MRILGCVRVDQRQAAVLLLNWPAGLSIEELNAAEVSGRAELSEGVGGMGVEEGVEVHINGQRQAVGLKCAGRQIEVSQQGFGRIEACAGVEASGIAEDFQQDLPRGFNAMKLLPAKVSRAAVWPPDRPFSRLQTALRLRPRSARSAAEARTLCAPATQHLKQNSNKTASPPVSF